MKINRIALLRGINVGKAKRVAMSDLRTLFEELGYQDVSTILNSGNVIFTAFDEDTSTSATKIEKALLAGTNVAAKVTVITAQELMDIIANNPFDEIATDASRLMISVFNNPQDRQQILSLEQQSWSPEALMVGARAAYLWCPNGVLESKVSASVGKVLGDHVTTRNWATIMKIKAILSKH